MATADPDRLPEPPDAPPASLPPLVRDLPTLWRLHREADPLTPRRYPTGRYRFDAPAGEYPVTYGNGDRLACFLEVYGGPSRIPATEGGRLLSQLIALRELRLVPLEDPATRRRLDPRLDGRIATALQYPVTQRWSRALHAWYPAADGLRYPSRHAGERALNYCLFLDRCGGAQDVRLHTLGALAELRPTVLVAAERYGLRVDLTWRP